jgi:hypothetical protein
VAQRVASLPPLSIPFDVPTFDLAFPQADGTLALPGWAPSPAMEGPMLEVVAHALTPVGSASLFGNYDLGADWQGPFDIGVEFNRVWRLSSSNFFWLYTGVDISVPGFALSVDHPNELVDSHTVVVSIIECLSEAVLATITTAISGAVSHTARLVSDGTTLTALLDGVAVLTYTPPDMTLAASPFLGLFFDNDGAITMQVPRVFGSFTRL